MRSSCCRSASITAITGVVEARAPSTTADDSPRRPIRRVILTRRAAWGSRGKKSRGAVRRAVIYKNPFPLDPSQGDAQLFQQRLDIAGLIKRRNHDAKLQRRLADFDLCRDILLEHEKEALPRFGRAPCRISG